MGSYGIFIPTLNAGSSWKSVLKRINAQTVAPVQKLVIDSGSNDGTVALAMEYGFDVSSIDPQSFTHGLVRKIAVRKMQQCDYILFLTQDVLLAEDSCEKLVQVLMRDSKVAIAYGRQISPKNTANILEIKEREVNYPSVSRKQSLANKKELGIKVAFNSDAFSMYNCEAVKQIGDFPEQVEFAEDIYMAAKAVDNGYSVYYCAQSVAYHSNHLGIRGLFKRYQHIGQFHKENAWIQKKFGNNEGDGVKLVLEEIKFLFERHLWYLIPYSIFRNGVKYLGYKFPK